MKENGYKVRGSDIIDRGYPGTKIKDFLTYEFSGGADVDIITNPPYKYAQEFVEKSIEVIKEGNRVAMFLKLQFLEGQARRKMYDKYPPKIIYVFSKRALCAKNGEFMADVLDREGNVKLDDDNNPKKKLISSAVAYAWFIWEKGFTGEPVIRWI